MSVNELNKAGFDFSLLQAGKAGQASAKPALGKDFQSTLQERLADFKSQAMNLLMNGDAGDGIAGIASLLGQNQDSSSTLDALLGNAGTSQALSASGRNNSLFDPESAYQMMTQINHKDVTYKAEFAEMTDMKSYVSAMQQEALTLGKISMESAADEVRSHLQAFANAYNGWIDRFDEVLEGGGLLAGTHAATASQWELEKSVENIFNGAASGVGGMGALGFDIDPVSNMASLDTRQLESVLHSNMNGALKTIQEFSANFAKSAELLNTDNNFIPNRLSNLNRVIDYIDTNKTDLQAEFGKGDAANPSGELARALASYKAIRGTDS